MAETLHSALATIAVFGGLFAAALSMAFARLPEDRLAPRQVRYRSWIQALWIAIASSASALIPPGPAGSGAVAAVAICAVLYGVWVFWNIQEVGSRQYARKHAVAMQEAITSPLPHAPVESTSSLPMIPWPDRAWIERLDAAVARQQQMRVELEVFEASGAVLFVVAQDGTIVYSAGRGHEVYGTSPQTVVGTRMDEWPRPDAWAAAKLELEKQPDCVVTQDLPEWVKPSRVAYSALEDGRIVGVSVPRPEPVTLEGPTNDADAS